MSDHGWGSCDRELRRAWRIHRVYAPVGSGVALFGVGLPAAWLLARLGWPTWAQVMMCAAAGLTVGALAEVLIFNPWHRRAAARAFGLGDEERGAWLAAPVALRSDSVGEPFTLGFPVSFVAVMAIARPAGRWAR